MLVQPNQGVVGANILMDNLSPIIITPIKLLNFTPKVLKDYVELDWTTASEQNNSYFVIERSLDSYTYRALETIPAGGNSSSERHYSFNDYYPASGLQYYRLKQVDIDGNASYSAIATVRIKNIKGVGIETFRASSSSIIVKIGQDSYSNVELAVVNMLGQKVYTQTISPESLHAEVSCDIANLPKGIYMFLAQSDNGLSEVIKFYKD
jgi:hypothetical protein